MTDTDLINDVHDELSEFFRKEHTDPGEMALGYLANLYETIVCLRGGRKNQGFYSMTGGSCKG